MNLQTHIARTLDSRRPQPIVIEHATQPSRFSRGQRNFGTGYGNSSGYASGKRYVRDWGNARFRFA